MEHEENADIATPSSSHKRKEPDEDELLGNGSLNECDYLDDDDDVDNEKTILRAQQPSTIERDDGIKITPFNLDEERKEGEFDKDGNFIFKKKSHKLKRKDDEDYDDDDDDGDNIEDDQDTWAESIDWDALEQKEREERGKKKYQLSSSKKVNKTEQRKSPEPAGDKLLSYKQMLRIMRPDETVQKTIRRLGNEVPKRRPKKPAGRSSQPTDVDDTLAANVAEAKRKLDLIIELAHQRLEEGDIDIYQRSYEALEEAIN